MDILFSYQLFFLRNTINFKPMDVRLYFDQVRFHLDTYQFEILTLNTQLNFDKQKPFVTINAKTDYSTRLTSYKEELFEEDQKENFSQFMAIQNHFFDLDFEVDCSCNGLSKELNSLFTYKDSSLMSNTSHINEQNLIYDFYIIKSYPNGDTKRWYKYIEQSFWDISQFKYFVDKGQRPAIEAQFHPDNKDNQIFYIGTHNAILQYKNYVKPENIIAGIPKLEINYELNKIKTIKFADIKYLFKDLILLYLRDPLAKQTTLLTYSLNHMIRADSMIKESYVAYVKNHYTHTGVFMTTTGFLIELPIVLLEPNYLSLKLI